MGRRLRAAQTKMRLWDIMRERAKLGTDSLDVVQIFRTRFPEIGKQDQEDLIDIGLMVLAGRVIVSNRPNDSSQDLFSNSGYPEFVPVKVMVGNRAKTMIKQGRQLTPREYFVTASVAGEKTNRPETVSKREAYRKCMEEMRDKQLLDMTVEEYLERQKN